jgi:hypothetical protein
LIKEVKTKLTITVLLGILIFVFVINKSNDGTGTSSPLLPPAVDNSNISSDFLIWGMDVGKAITGGADPQINYSQFQDLNFNVWHKYPMVWDPTINTDAWNNGWTFHNFISNDRLDTPVSRYSGTIYSKVLHPNDRHEIYTLMDRPKIEYLCYGARSDYQCESEKNIENQDLKFYHYEESETGEDYRETFNGEKVRGKYCGYVNMTDMDEGWMDKGYTVKNLYTNREQIDMHTFQYQDDMNHTWYVKPRIRIKTTDAFANKKVCKIEIRKCNGDELTNRSVDLYGLNFVDRGKYEGRYIEDYFGLQPGKLQFGGNPDWDEINPAREGIYTTSCGVDFRVYWYGKCEMWIDYVRVEDGVAKDLLSNDSLNSQWVTYNKWMQDEVNLALQSSRPLKFYIEEFEFNNLSCMAYVNKKLQQYSNNKCDLMCEFLEGRFYYHIGPDASRWKSFSRDADYINRNLIQKCNLKQFFIANYPFIGGAGTEWYKISSAFERGNLTYDKTTGVLANPVDPASYDTWLQGEMDGTPPYTGSFTTLLKLSDTISKTTGLPNLQMVQTHLLYAENGSGVPTMQLREPTNEEIEMCVNVALTYGARGISYYEYNAFNPRNPVNLPPGKGYTYGRGLVNPVNENVDPADVIPRMENAYGEQKWNKIIEINQKLKTWGPALMSFTNADRRSYIYRLERKNCLNETYFSDIVSYYPSAVPLYICAGDAPGETSPPNWQYDCNQERYLQVAVFKNPNEANQNYFMIVNRRCSPFINENSYNNNGGRRKIRVRFDADHNDLAGYNEWIIKDAANSAWEKQFNKTQQLYIDLGEFMPGEGRLYHLVPKEH